MIDCQAPSIDQKDLELAAGDPQSAIRMLSH
jgi:hypothetical protein